MAESCTGKADSGGKMNYKNVKIAEGARIAKQSVILGNVTIGRDSCVLYYAVIRGDDAPVVIGEETNIRDHRIFSHKTAGSYDTVVSDLCTIQDHGSHSDQCPVSDGTSMDHRIMSHRTLFPIWTGMLWLT